MSYQLWLQGLAAFHRQKRPNTPWRPSPARSQAGFPHIHYTCCRAKTPAPGHRLPPAAERKAQKPLSHPLVFRGCVGSWLISSPIKLYKLELPPWHCLFSMFDELHCDFIVVNCLLISGKRVHFPHHWDYVKGTAIQPLVIHFSTGELTDLITKVCTVPRAPHFSILQLQIVKKITITITIKTQFLLAEEESSAST